MKSTIVSDTSSLIIFTRLGRVDLLVNQFEKVIISERVVKEIAVKEDDVAQVVTSNTLFEMCKSNDVELLEMLDGILDYGEVEAIALAREQDHILLIDEKKGRKIALGMKIRIIGFLGVLLLNYKQGKLSQVDIEDIVQKAKKLKFRLSARLEKHFFELL